MPNWCSNSIRLSNEDKTKIDAIVKVLEKGERVFTHLLPMPEAFKDTQSPNNNEEQRQKLIEQYGYGDWYEWCVNNWGVKWDADVYSWEREDDNTVFLAFQTAWAPPIELYDNLTDEGWTVNGTYIEEGCAFVGEYVDGIDNYYEYGDATSETILDYIPAHLDEEYCIGEQMAEWEEDNKQWESGEDETKVD